MLLRCFTRHPFSPLQALAKVLRQNDPKNYPDDNHKPEMAVALTPFDVSLLKASQISSDLFPTLQGLCGFRPALEIAGFLDTVPEFKATVGADVAAAFEAAVHKPEVKRYQTLT